MTDKPKPTFIIIEGERYYFSQMFDAYQMGVNRRKRNLPKHSMTGYSRRDAKYSEWYLQGYNDRYFSTYPISEIAWDKFIAFVIAFAIFGALFILALPFIYD